MRVFQVTFNVLQSIFGVAKCTGCSLIVTSKKLRNVSFAIAVQIAIANLVLISNVFLTVFNSMAGQWLMGLPFCV